MLDLNRLVQGDSSLYLFLAQGINDQGEIVGTAFDASGEQVGFLAVPAYEDESEAAASSKVERNGNAGKIILPSDFKPHLTGFSRILFEAAQAQ